MSDEQENVDAGSETSGEQAAETTATEQSETAATDTADTNASETAQAEQETGADSAGGAADVAKQAGDACTTGDGKDGTLQPLNDGSLVCVASPVVGEVCICPDGRAGTVAKLDDSGTLYCLPTDQG